MRLLPTTLPGVVIVEPAVFRDERGWFMECWNEQRFAAGLLALGLPVPRRFLQDNHSGSVAGVLRGLHYQLPPHPQGKLVRVVKGAVFDVAVDIRLGSATFGRWVGAELSEDNHRQLWIPEGFAHGVLALHGNTQLAYKATDTYGKGHERSIRWDDPTIGIEWPLPASAIRAQLAPRDATAPLLAEAEVFRTGIDVMAAGGGVQSYLE